MLTFEEFRAKLADVVTVAINRGTRVSVDFVDCCPLGCWPGVGDRKPSPIFASLIVGILDHQASYFACGFDGHPVGDESNKFYQLGRLYRERFSRAK